MPILSDTSSPITGVLYLALLMLVGYGVLCVTVRPGIRHWIEMLGVCFALGVGTTSMLLFFASLVGLTPSRPILVAIACIAILAIAIKARKSGWVIPNVPTPRQKFDAITLLGIASLGVIVAAACNVTAHSNWAGLNDIDAFAIWMFKAKIVSMNALRPMPTAFTLPNLSYSHQDYPLSLPFLVAGLYAAVGHINDEQAKILLLPMYLAVVATVYSAIRRMHRRAVAMAVTAIFAAAPTLTRNAGLLVAETPLILVWSAALAMGLRWIETRERGDLTLTFLLALFAAFTKNEGLALFPIIAVVTLVLTVLDQRSVGFRDWFFSVVPAVIMLAPWLTFRVFLPKTHENYGGRLKDLPTLLHHLGRLGYIGREFIGTVFDSPDVGLIWCILLLVAILGFRGFGRRTVRVLWVILLVQLAVYSATFIVTPWDPLVLIPMIGPKLLTQASPVAAVLIAFHLKAVGNVRFSDS